MKICKTIGCGQKHTARGLCLNCYQRARKSGELQRKISINVGQRCKVGDCCKDAKALGMCIPHYERFKKYGDPLASAVRRTGGQCLAVSCDGVVAAKGLCRKHYARASRHGDPDGFSEWYKKRDLPITDSAGYVLVYEPKHPNSKKSGRILEHRKVMSEMIGRPLLSSENVHHVNGDKSDNSPENLELWVSSQPSGQRVQDRVRWFISQIKEEMDAASKLDASILPELTGLAEAINMLYDNVTGRG